MATLIRSDLEFILQQILIAEAHAAGADLSTLVPNVFAPYGLRTVDGSYNNLVPGQFLFGAADQPFPTLVPADSPYGTAPFVMDPEPRIISNLIADMSSNNPAAVAAFVEAGLGTIRESDGALLDANGEVIPAGTLLTIPAVAPDVGLSAPFNSWFTFFGQFFDHGLDLVNKSSTEIVLIPLMPDDPLYVEGSHTNFMVVSRAAGTPTNQTTPFVDQNQTYTSHASHQVFLREYVLDADGHPVATGRMLSGKEGGLATWADVKEQARTILGIALDDLDIHDVPLLVTDPYGKFVPDPLTGLPQLVISAGPPPVTLSGNLAEPVDATLALGTGHAFLNDISHAAAPAAGLVADGDDVINSGAPQPAGTYDDELLARHFITGDGRGNENIALTTVHHVFHSEHNRQIEAIKATVLATGDAGFIASWQLEDGTWNGERLFQAARFATEMQYQHLVFEEFARKLHPTIDEFLAPEGYDATIDPAIFGEFAHAVYRLGHSMLTESIDRFSPDFVPDDITLLNAFLNPVAFDNDGALTAEQAAGAVIRGMTRQVGNEIDEFVTDAVRNSLLGLPLDLAAINIARGRDTGVPTLNEARREFFDMTSDSKLKPYTSWLDLTQNLKHEASAINFIAAYGTHAAFAGLTAVADRRAVATALVFGGPAVLADGTEIAIDDADRLDFLNSTGAYASTADGVTTTGVDDIDLWIGGLAEKIMPFGGMLGSTFAFVFETQLESLQNGDRFYYLARTAGLNFGNELEANSFSQLVMLNTDATHLPADIFSTPAWTLEVDQSRQFTGLGVEGRDDPTGGTALQPLVVRDDPATEGADNHYLQYTGEDHVVLGGTAGNDTLVASIGDDSLWGDEGKDRMEGGAGNDNIDGGAGDDILTDSGGDDVLMGQAGNDVIHGGQGLNLILGGDGNDFIVTGEDISTTFGGQGNDFILGSKLNLPTLGNEGDDWIEFGTQDGAGGDNFDPLGMGTIRGNDVFVTEGGFDEAEGEGGDDVFVFSDGEDHFGGGGGFDWASYQNDAFGVTADLFINARIEPPATPSNQGVQDRFAEVEGLSGSAHSDYLRGDSEAAHAIGGPAALDNTLIDLGIYRGLEPVLGAGVSSFNAGNIILGGAGSDLLEGRGDNDIIDGDRYLNVRISVRQNIDGTGPEIRSARSMTELVGDMVSGAINPGQLQIVREILVDAGGFNFDTAMFSGNSTEYTITTAPDGTVTVAHTTPLVPNLGDGIDTLRNIERLQFNDTAIVLAPEGLNAGPAGQLALNSTTPAVNQVLSVSALGVTDADNVSATNATGALGANITYYWQAEVIPGSGVFADIVTAAFGNRESANGATFRVTPDLDGVALRVRAVYQDAHGVLENVFSPATAPVSGTIAIDPVTGLPQESEVATAGIHLIRSDLQFILDQIRIAEAHSGAYETPAQDLRDLLPNTRLPWGLRTVDGSFNNLVPGQEFFGGSDQDFPLALAQIFRNDLDGDAFDLNGPGPGGEVTNTNYASIDNVADADPRIISNLISDQTANNPAAVDANGGNDAIMSPGMDGIFGTADDRPVFFIPNSAPDAGLSAQFNSWFTFFGQFFDHGLDLVDKGPGAIFIPLEADDPLIAGADGIFGTGDDLAASQRFMVVTRATNTAVQAGADGILGTADDVHRHNNETTPFVDQNQTYTSHASHQVFLREYGVNAAGHTVATGRLLDGANQGIANWEEVKLQAKEMLGILLSDTDVFDVPLLATDLYGKFIPGPNGYAQVVTNLGLIEGTADGLDIHHLPGGAIVARTGHAFLNDIAHTAAPINDRGQLLLADADSIAGGPVAAGRYDDELLDKHFITGDGRGNENIGLTSVHFIFHAEHNRLVEYLKEAVTASNDPDFIAQWKLDVGTPAESWNGERLFQAARFSTEMQYQHLVFEEFARKVQPQIDVFLTEGQGYDSTINPAIVAEFAHVVYRFGHSMLTETVDRYDGEFNLVNGDGQLGLIAAFLNPLEFTASGANDAEAAGAVIRGVTRQAGNEIDEFVTEALRNNLLGLPLDLPAINIARGRDTGVPSLNEARAEFFAMTGDTQLKPYASWLDFASHLKHEASLVNFVAAYGTHATVANATTLAERRAAAYALVYGENGLDGLAGSGDEPVTAVPADRLDFMNGPAAVTGVNAIDLWIGGLAEKQMPFGGLLGSTFNFVFENQLESLQNGDRFYYLERTANLNFLSELENNTFAKLIMANTDVEHLPGDVFSTPAFTLEADPTKQFTGLGEFGRDDPTRPDSVIPLVIRDDPGTAGPDAHYLQYTGEDHVVLGGTSGRDTLVASDGDDTLYGDEDDDRLEGGFGNDMLQGGAGDDILTDIGGDDNLQGGDGDDAIHGGQGVNLLIGGHGNDFIVTGSDANESIAGPGNDFILGGPGNEMVFGNEGDDWIEHGMADGSAGDNFDSLGRDAVVGNDVFIGDDTTDRMDGEGGDDIMMGNGGQVDRYVGNSGFDWAVFEHPSRGAVADLNLRAFNTATALPNSVAAAQARFASVEGVSGSAFADVLIGDELDAAGIAGSGATGSVLTNFALISGLHAFVGLEATSFGAGNIILGGDGSDVIEGRGGDDLIDGDMSLNVRISVRANRDGTGDEIASADSMTELVGRVFSGEINPGQLVIVRELLQGTPDAFNFDTAVYRGVMAEYTWETDPVTGAILVTDSVVDRDGTDRLTNIERVQFADQAIVFGGFENAPEGLLTIDDTTPTSGQPLTVSAGSVIDPDNIDPVTNPTGAITGPISYFWQVELAPGSGVFEDIVVATPAGDLRATGTTFTPGANETGLALRVKAIYQDALGVFETVYSEATAPVENGRPSGVLRISDTTPTEGQPIAAVHAFTDPDGTALSTFSYQWQQSDLAGGDVFTDIAGATTQAFTPAQDQVNRQLRVIVTFTDDAGVTETLTSAATTVTGDLIPANNAAQTLTGTEGQDLIFGGGGADAIDGLGEDDTIDGGAGADNIHGGAGNDTVNYTFGEGADAVDGGEGTDTFNVLGSAANNLLTVTIAAGVVTGLAGSTLASIEAVTADLDGGTDTLSYAGATEAVAVDFTQGTATGFTSVAHIENAVGGSGNDTLAGAEGVGNTMTGGAGDDTYVVHDADDVVVEAAGGGLDTTLSAVNERTLSGNVENLAFVGVGNFTGTGNTLDNVVTGGGNHDTLSGGAGDDTVRGLAGSDVLAGDAGNDVLEGGTGNDALDGGSGNDLLSGGAHDDTLHGGLGSDTIVGGSGNDTITYTVGDGADAMDGGEDEDTLQVAGNANGNVLSVTSTGGVLATVANGTVANVESVTIDLGDGIDTLSFAGNTQAVTVDLGGSATGVDVLANVENATGGSGNDTLVSSAGIDNVLTGGAGSDTYVVHETADAVIEGAGAGTDEVFSTADSYTLSSNVENLTYAGSGNFTGTGNTQANRITGGLGDDVLSGLGGNDTLVGGAGNDTLSGGVGDDVLDAGEGDDVIDYGIGEGADTVDGGTGLGGGAGQDRLNIFGNEQANTLGVIYAAGALTSVAGGTLAGIEEVTADLQDGTDTLNYAGTAEGIAVDLGTGEASGFLSIASIENATGGSGDDTLAGAAGANNTLTGGAGNDTYYVHDAADVVVELANGGIDETRSFANSRTLSNNVENLTFVGTGDFAGIGNAGANVITGGSGNDALSGLNGDDTLNGEAGDDMLDGGVGNDVLNGGIGNDSLLGGAGNDTLEGGDDNDTLAGAQGSDAVRGGAGDDSIQYAMNDGADAVDGGAGADTLAVEGTGGADVLDVVVSGGIITTLENGTVANVETVNAHLGLGTDTLSYTGTTEAVTVDFTAGSATGIAALSGIESATGGSGNDLLVGALGTDNALAGAGGNDTYVVHDTTDTVTEAANAGTDEVRSVANSFTLSNNVENLTFIGEGNFTGTGNAQANLITGGAGNDTLSGGAGNDTLDGGAGSDAMDGGANNDVYLVGEATDTVTEAAGGGTDEVRTSLDSYTLGANVENLTYTGTGNFTGTGNTANNVITGGIGNDVLTGLDGLDTLNGGLGDDTLDGGNGNDGLNGSDGADVLAGGAGNDTLDGGTGIDAMTGGAGNDVYVVNDLGDVVTEATGGGTDEVRTTLASYTLDANVESLRFTGTGDFVGTGNGLNNTLTGGAGNDVLTGLAGNDVLNGGLGNDTLEGGAGNDTVNGGDGDDTARYALGDGVDAIDGGAGLDTLAISGGAGDDTLAAAVVGGVLTSVAGLAPVDVEAVSADLGAGIDTLSYAGTTEAVQVNFALGTATGIGSISNVENAVGGSGNDTLAGAAAVLNTLSGRAGDDTYVVHDTNDVVDEAAAEGIDEVQAVANSYTLANANVENLRFIGAGDFSGTGNAADNVITGGAGSDTLDGAGGSDVLDGGAGNDLYLVNDTGETIVEAVDAGTDEVRTTLASYTLVNENVENLTFAGLGDFTGTGNAAANVITGGDGNDTLTGAAGNDAMNGGAGDDTFRHAIGDGADAVDGGTGVDTLAVTGGAADDTLDIVADGTVLTHVEGGTLANVESVSADLGAGSDTLSYAGSTAAVTVDLGAGSATGFSAVANVENVTGGSGDDVLEGALDVINALAGGAGDDTFVVQDTADVVLEDAGGGIDEVQSMAIAYTIADDDVENLRFTGAGDFAGTGNASANAITGGAGNDTLDGAGGNDTLEAGVGIDVVQGGDGDDTVLYTVGDGADIVDGGLGQDRLEIRGTTAADTLAVVFAAGALTAVAGGSISNVESVLADLQGGADTLSYAGSTAAVTANLAGTASGFTSIAGIENVVGGSGNDSFTSALGVVNTMAGAEGNDTYVVLETTDVVVEAAGQGTDSVQSVANSYTLSDNVENLSFTGAGSFTGTGNAEANVIAGGGGADLLSGLGGNDVLNGGAGNDTLSGDDGNDTLSGGNGDDALLGGDGLDSLGGGTGNDTLTGGAGSDTLDGGAGSDSLIGGDGNDTMDGGANDDIFVFQPSFGQDRVSGFDANAAGGQDRLDVTALGINAGNFGASVSILVTNVDGVGLLDTLVTIGSDSVALLGVNGVGENAITQADFILS